MSGLLKNGKSLKIALLVGKIKNAGDYLIAERTKQLLKSVYPECEVNEYIRVYRFHRGIASNVESYQIVLKYLEDNQIAYFDIANDWVGFKQYDDADLHIGFRVHAHLYNLSKRNISVLISEDGRGLAVNETLGLPIIRPYNNLVINEGRFMAAPNEYLVYQLDDVIKNMIDTNYYELERAFETMNHYYQNMTKHISTMKDFVR